VQRPFTPLLAFVIALVLLCDLAVVVVHALDANTTLVTGGRGQASRTESTEVEVVPGPGQAFVTGTIDKLAVDGAQVPPLPTPLTITAVERGRGKLAIEKALVGGRRVTITWDGGTPLPVSGNGGIDLGTTHVDADGESLVYSLGGAPRTFVPGTYTLGSTVAVGTGAGLAAPRDGVQFTADKDTVLAPTGDVVVRLAAQKVDLVGPGKLQVTGELKVRFPDRRQDASTVTFGAGPYRVSLDPGNGGVTIDAILQGSVDVG
jgi:hypothetical protein